MSDPSAETGRDAVRLAAARDALSGLVAPIDAIDRVPLGSADGRVLADATEALRDVPGFRRAATDGYAVRASDTAGATDRSPAVLRAGSGAVRVESGRPLPEEANAVVGMERAAPREDGIAVFEPATEGENVTPAGGDVEAGERLFEAGRRLRPSDLGLLRAAGHGEVPVRVPPSVGVVPTGDELVRADPGETDVLETNGLAVSQHVQRWGGRATYREAVGDDPAFLRVALQRDLTKDLVVTIGGTGIGERDLLPGTVEELGEVAVHGVAMRPGGTVAVGRIQETPVAALPGSPAACIAAAVQFVRPAIGLAAGFDPGEHPRTTAPLDRDVASEPGVRTFVPARLADRDGEPAAVPVEDADALSGVARADGWIEVEESRAGVSAGETVTLQEWEP